MANLMKQFETFRPIARRVVLALLMPACLVAMLTAAPAGATVEHSLAAWDRKPDGSKILNLILPDAPRPLPSIHFVDAQGRTKTLGDFRGRVTAVHFWATWCGPCRTELPTVDYLQREIGEQNLTVLALSVDRGGASTVKDYYSDIGINDLPIYVDQGMESARTLRVIGLPYTIFVDREGREVARVLGDRDWSDPDVVALVRKIVAM